MGDLLRDSYLSLLTRLFLSRPAVGMEVLAGRGVPESGENRGDVTREEIAERLKELLAEKAELPLNDVVEQAISDAEWYESGRIRIISALDAAYPKLLLDCPDAPPVLYMLGDVDFNAGRNIAIVGTRLASSYGRDSVFEVVKGLADGGYKPQIVSGLAYGIDISAHRAALSVGVPTIAVLPNGLDMIYPQAHRRDAIAIMRNGALVTEFPRGTQPYKCNFLKRNRIIAGMSRLVLVAESRVKGGSMTTAEMANSYNREVFAVPGRITDVNSFGCNYLICKNVAHICNCAAAIPEEMGWNKGPEVFKNQRQLFNTPNRERERLLSHLSRVRYMDADELCTLTGMDFSTISLLLLELELEGVVSPGPNGYSLN